jgi:hypothetical protein
MISIAKEAENYARRKMKDWTPPSVLDKACHRCGTPFELPNTPANRYITICPECQNKREEAHPEIIEARRIKSFNSICPVAYQSINPALLPNPSKLEEVLKWEYGPDGMIFMGSTGSGKTRLAWALMKREVLSGRSIKALDSRAGLQYASIYSQSPQNVMHWVSRLVLAEILLLDDIFKIKLTDSFEATIFTVIDQRISWHRPTIITSNDTGETLKARLSVDRADPLLRRLRECCSVIQF